MPNQMYMNQSYRRHVSHKWVMSMGIIVIILTHALHSEVMTNQMYFMYECVMLHVHASCFVWINHVCSMFRMWLEWDVTSTSFLIQSHMSHMKHGADIIDSHETEDSWIRHNWHDEFVISTASWFGFTIQVKLMLHMNAVDWMCSKN